MTYRTTKQEAREFYADIACNRYDLDRTPHVNGCPAEAMWDEWFKSEIRNARNEAWDEGYRQGAYDESRYPAIEVEARNPYRGES